MARKSRAPRQPRKPKGITTAFEEELIRVGPDEAKEMILTRQKQLEEVGSLLRGEGEGDAAKAMRAAKSALSLLKGPTMETRTVLTNQIRACLKRLEELGQ
jgi:hypothetical protein